MTREPLPDRRNSFNFSITFQGEKYDVTIGHYADGRPGEVFVTRVFTKASAKIGTLLDDLAHDAAILVSVAIQHGTPFKTLQHAIVRNSEGEPSTIIGAIIDYIAADQGK